MGVNPVLRSQLDSLKQEWNEFLTDDVYPIIAATAEDPELVYLDVNRARRRREVLSLLLLQLRVCRTVVAWMRLLLSGSQSLEAAVFERLAACGVQNDL